MFRLSWLVFLALCHCCYLNLAEENRSNPRCPAVRCGKLDRIKFPFSSYSHPQSCGVLKVDGCQKKIQRIQLDRNGSWYEIDSIAQANTMFIRDGVFQEHLDSNSCETFNNLTFSRLPFLSFQILYNVSSLYKCDHLAEQPLGLDLVYSGCSNFRIYRATKLTKLPTLPPSCSLIQLPSKSNLSRSNNIFLELSASFSLHVRVSSSCWECHYRKRGECQVNNEKEFYCANATGGDRSLGSKIGLGVGLGGGLLVVIVVAMMSLYFTRRHYKQRQDSSNFLQREYTSSRNDLEDGSVCFGISIFTYKELETATNNFDSKKELGDGGFGAVYYGKLRDGREVAVKRLYQNNYRRLEQFMNEVKILTRIRHKNLVSLYGCTSRHSRELLLVYEFIRNGTVADHLHGDRSNSNQLTWPVRMRIAIETANALAYLHASDIVHRDVKTTNILLDSNFSVKVADFGLSRLFPTDVTHVSTAPQGTPGYVDPEYHQCYQLTDKSDVYSFGVVLIELISSMPAVDITRDRSEINLTNLAINKIENSAVDELIDLSLGYQTDTEVRRMTTCIAGLAFQCIQQVKETRPTMLEVLEELTRIETGESKEKQQEVIDDKLVVIDNTVPPASPAICEDSALLKHVRMLPSPDSVTNRWVSSDSITPTVSGLD